MQENLIFSLVNRIWKHMHMELQGAPFFLAREIVMKERKEQPLENCKWTFLRSFLQMVAALEIMVQMQQKMWLGAVITYS